MIFQCFAGENWEVISRNMPDRTDQQCQQRWTKVVNPNLIKGISGNLKCNATTLRNLGIYFVNFRSMDQRRR